MNMRAIKNAHEIHRQIMEYCEKIIGNLQADGTSANHKPAPPPETKKEEITKADGIKNTREMIVKCLCRGLPLNVAQKATEQERSEEMRGVCYKAKRAGMCKIHPSSVLALLSNKPEFVIFTEIVFTKSVYMRYVTEVSPAWLQQQQ